MVSGEAAGPWRITFDTNPDECNLHCVMCEGFSEHSDRPRLRREADLPPRRMDIALIRRVVAEAKPLGLREIIPSTMGEPLLYEGFDAILDLCREFDVKLNLTTNGTFPRRSASEWARRICPVGSDVKVSWNGARPETAQAVMKGIRWEVAQKNLREFLAVRDSIAREGGNRCTVTLQTTFLETNVEELPEMVRLAARLGIDRVKGHHLWVHFPGIADQSMRRNEGAVARWNRIVEEAHSAVEQFRKPDGGAVRLENILPIGPTGEEAPHEWDCPFLGREAWVAPEGRFNPCCAPDALRRTLGDFGSLERRPLAEIWNGSEYLELVEGYRKHALCRSCTMRRPQGLPPSPSTEVTV